VADLLQRQAEPAGLGDEVQDAQDVRLVHAIAGGRPPRLRHDAARFIQTQRLAADPAARGDLSDGQEVLRHGLRIDLAAWGRSSLTLHPPIHPPFTHPYTSHQRVMDRA